MGLNNKYNAQDFELALIEALKLPRHTSAVDLSIKAGEPIKVRCEHWPADIEARSAGKLIEEFSLFRREDVKPNAISIDDQFEQVRKRIHDRIDIQCEIAQVQIQLSGQLATHSICRDIKPVSISASVALFTQSMQKMARIFHE